jgi:hypothetical protein
MELAYGEVGTIAVARIYEEKFPNWRQQIRRQNGNVDLEEQNLNAVDDRPRRSICSVI